MKTTRTRQWFRSVALGCAMAAGTTAFGDYYKEWSAEGKAYWDGESSWTASNEGTVLDDYRVTQAAAQIAFDKAVTDNAANFYVYGGSATLSADESSFGLTKDNWFCVGVWFGGSAAATIESGTYSFAEVNVGRWASGTLTLAGGSVTTPNIYVGTDEVTGTVTIDDGATVSAGQIAGGSKGSLEVNGGTFANATDATISVAVTGSGTLTKTGAGALAITGDVTAFTGSITVAEGAGSVTVGETVVAAGETKSFAPDTTYYWSGNGEDNLWSNVNNWLVGGIVPTAPPAADSVVVIPEEEGELEIKITTAAEYTGYLTINRDVKFVRATTNKDDWNSIYVTKVDGIGTLTLAGGGSYNASDRAGDRVHVYPTSEPVFQIDTDLNTTGRIRIMRNGSIVPTLTLNGALRGNGYVYFNNYHNGEGLRFNGDTSEFEGVFEGGGANGYARDATKFGGDARGSALASWRFGRWDQNGSGTYGYTPFLVSDTTYQFGQLNAPLFHFWRGFSGQNTTGATVEVGAIDGKTSTVNGSIAPDNTLRKVGADSTLEFTQSGTAGGLVEAYEGTTVIKGTATGFTLKFTGPTATIKIARSSTTTTDTGVEDDPETTDVDESKTTTTTANIPASFVPGFADELAGGQYEVHQEVVEGVTYDVYTVVKVAKDSNDVEYYSVAAAITALAEAENKTITLTHDYGTTVELPLGYTLDSAGFACTVTGVSGVGVVEKDGVWTTVDNSEAEWVGGAEGNWNVAANWSTGVVPNSGTKVVFNGDATVFLAGNTSYDCGELNVAKGKTVTFAPVDYNQNNYPRIVVHGDIASKGECTVKIFRCGIDNGKGSTVNVRPTILFENEGGSHDSWMTGNFDFQSGLSGTGHFISYDGKINFSTGSFTVDGDNVIEFMQFPTFSGKSGQISGGGANGTGRVVVHSLPARTDAQSAYFKSAFTNSEKWTGTLELNGVTIENTYYCNGIDFTNYGSANSTVCVNGVTGYMRFSSGATTEVGKVKTIEIGANGLTLNKGFSSGAFGYIIAADITGSGPIHFSSYHNDASVGQYFLTGSLDGFTGAIDFGSLTSYRPAVIIKDADAETPAVNDYGQIIVAEGSDVTVAATWDAPGGFVVYGDVTVASTGSITSNNGLCGDGTVTYEALPATAPGCCAGITSTGTNRDVPAWTGTVVLPGRSGSGQVPLAGLGREGSTIVVNGDITGQDANSIYLSGGTAINAKVELKGLLKLTNGTTDDNYKFAEVTGAGDMFLSATGSPGSPTYTYTFTKLNDYTGTINAVKTSDTKYAALAIGTVNVSEFVVGEPVVKLAANANLTTDPADITFTVDGDETDFDLMKADDGNIYVIVAEVTVPGDEPTTKQFGSYEAAAAFAEANNVTSFAVLAGDGELDGWTYDSEVGTLTVNENTVKVADLDAEFATIADARDAVGFLDGYVVTLIRDSDEDVTLAANETLNLDVNGKSYAGAIGGAGMFVAVQDFTPAFDEGWTGTFVIGWHIDGGDNGTAFPAAKYGNEASTVRFDAGASNIFFTNAAKNGPECLTKLYLASDVSIKNGWGISGENTRLTTFSEVTIEDGVTFTLRDNPGAQTYFAITKLVTEGGKIVVPAWNTLTISEIVTDTTSPYLALEKDVNGTLSGLASVTVNGVAKALCYRTVNEVSGLYDPVAKFGDTTYDTLAGAIGAAKGSTENVVELLSDTDEGYTFVVGDKVAIKWNGKSTGEIVISGTDAFNAGSWNQETGTTTYDIRTAVAYITVGETVTPKTDPMAALNDFLASPTGATLRFVGTNPFAETPVPCTTYDADTLTYTKLPAVAKIGEGQTAVPYPTLAAACAAAEEHSYTMVTLLVARDTLNETIPDGWEYNTPEASGTEFGTLTKVVSGDIEVNTDGCDFTVNATTAAAITTATGVETTDPNFGKVAIAYVVGGELDEDGDVVIPTPTITVVNGKATVVYSGDDAHTAGYMVTCTLWSFDLADANDSSKWTEVATGGIGDDLVDTNATAASKFYKVTVTVTNSQLGNETDSGEGA